MLDKLKLEWIDADAVQPPAGLTTKGAVLNRSELVALKSSNGIHEYGWAIYEDGHFKRWSSKAQIIEWAYYN
jgi:hypothetical protein